MLRAIICALSLAGLADSLYFTLAYYGRIRKARWVPEILCAREGSSCVTVVQTPYARVFRGPEFAVGDSLLRTVLLIAGIKDGWRFGFNRYIVFSRFAVPLGMMLLVLASAGTVVLGFYLIYALRRQLHV